MVDQVPPSGAGELKGVSRGAKVFGIVTLVAGVLSLFAPLVTGIAVAVMVGLFLLAGGLARAIYAFQSKTFGQGLVTFLFGALGILCGGAMLAQPILGLASLTMVIAIYLIVSGITEVVAAFGVRPSQGWGWLAFSGLVSVLLGGMLWSQWPLSGGWAVGTLVGVHLVFAGWAMIALGSVGTRVAKATG